MGRETQSPPLQARSPASGQSSGRGLLLGCRLVTRQVAAPSQSVWDVLADGWFYAAWVVGASRVRDVDSAWPATGSRVHHSFGVWPAVLNDISEVLECDPGRLLVIKAQGRPAGAALVRLTISPDGPGSCTVGIVEDAVAGPGRAVPQVVRQSLIVPRNTEALRRLGLIAQGRRGQSDVGAPAGRPA